jgi:hypothetical protein
LQETLPFEKGLLMATNNYPLNRNNPQKTKNPCAGFLKIKASYLATDNLSGNT